MQENTIKSLEQIEQELSSFHKKIEEDHQRIEDSHRQIIVSQQNVQQLERERDLLLEKASDKANTENHDQEMVSATPVALQGDSDKSERDTFYKSWDSSLMKKISENRTLGWQEKRWLRNPSRMKAAENFYGCCGGIAVIVFGILFLALVGLYSGHVKPISPDVKRELDECAHFIFLLMKINCIPFSLGFWGFWKIDKMKNLILSEQKELVSWRGHLRGSLIEKRISKNKNIKTIDRV